MEILVKNDESFQEGNRRRQSKFYSIHKQEISDKNKAKRLEFKEFQMMKEAEQKKFVDDCAKCIEEQECKKCDEEPTQVIPFVMNEDNVVEKLMSLILHGKKEISVKTHVNNIRKFFKITECSTLDLCLQNPKKIIEKLEQHEITVKGVTRLYSSNSKLGLIHALLYFLDNFKIVLNKEIRSEYQNYEKLLKIRSHIEVDNKIVSKQDAVLDFGIYQKKILQKFGVDSREHLLVSLYSEICCRDDFILNLINLPEEAVDKNKNYLVKKGVYYTIIFNQYKTSKLNDPLIIKTTLKLSNLLSKYIEKNHVTDVLFKKGNSSFISTMNKKIGLTGATGINYLRHSIISSAIKGFEDDPEKRLELSKKCCHSPITQIRYIRQIV